MNQLQVDRIQFFSSYVTRIDTSILILVQLYWRLYWTCTVLVLFGIHVLVLDEYNICMCFAYPVEANARQARAQHVAQQRRERMRRREVAVELRVLPVRHLSYKYVR